MFLRAYVEENQKIPRNIESWRSSKFLGTCTKCKLLLDGTFLQIYCKSRYCKSKNVQSAGRELKDHNFKTQ